VEELHRRSANVVPHVLTSEAQLRDMAFFSRLEVSGKAGAPIYVCLYIKASIIHRFIWGATHRRGI
jgi:hypothetical protein